MLNTKLLYLTGCFGAASLTAAALLTNPLSVLAQTANPAATALVPSASVPAAAPAITAPTALPESAVSLQILDGSHPAQTFAARPGTVADALAQAGIILNKPDRVSPALDTTIAPGMQIAIQRVTFSDTVHKVAIPYKTIFSMSRSVAPGQIEHGHVGVPGVITETYRTGYIDGKRTTSWLVSRVETQKPVDQTTLAGIRVASAAALPSRGGYNRLDSLWMTATGYTPTEGSGDGRCATGMRAGYGVVAVDPRVIPLGSKLYIQGYGYAVAGDTGGAIRGNRIDLGSTTYRQAMDIGRRRVKVWVLRPSR